MARTSPLWLLRGAGWPTGAGEGVQDGGGRQQGRLGGLWEAGEESGWPERGTRWGRALKTKNGG